MPSYDNGHGTAPPRRNVVGEREKGMRYEHGVCNNGDSESTIQYYEEKYI